MTASILRVRATAVASIIAVILIALFAPFSDADARGGKEYFSQTYQFDKPMNGYQGFSGAYHCSYVKTPKTVCNSAGKCKKVWELLQTCQ